MESEPELSPRIVIKIQLISVYLKGKGTLVVFGDQTYRQTKLIKANSYHEFSNYIE